MSVIEKTRPITSSLREPDTADDILAKPMFTMSQICNAAGAPPETVRTWFKRNVLSIDGEARLGCEPEAVGLGRMLTGYTAMAVAIMARLTIVGHRDGEVSGYNLDAARDAAYTFVFTASEEGRDPCRLFRQGETALIVAKDGKYPLARVVNLGGDGGEMTWRDLLKAAGASVNQFEVLLLDELWQTVFQRLGIRAQIENAE